VLTGQRMRLNDVPLQAITASMPGNGGIAPGGKAKLSVVATATDGRTLATVGTGDGKVLLDSYAFDDTLVSVNADGVVRLPADPHLSEGRTPHVRIHAIGQPTPEFDLDIPVRYDVPYAATYSGRTGADGFIGMAGMDGASGGTGSYDPDNPSPGGNGSDGSDGTDGNSGFDGGKGPAVHVTIALAPGGHPLLRVRASESGHDHDFIVDPTGGSLALTVRGGAGGAGGRGGAGGQGGSGGGGLNPGSSGSSGRAGSDGSPGNGGPAGSVSVAVDPAAAPYLDRFHVSNVDGNGKPGPAPVITVGPVASPW
jgi:hypothetical protein